MGSKEGGGEAGLELGLPQRTQLSLLVLARTGNGLGDGNLGVVEGIGVG